MAIRTFGQNSEYKKLNAVLLYRPGPEIGGHPAPPEVQHLRPIDHAALSREYDALHSVFRGLGVRTLLIDPSPLSDDRQYRYNMMYCRDLFFMTPKGAILSNMANSTRKAEVLYAERALRDNNIPVLHSISDNGTFEGADALWVRDTFVVIGVGGRTNRSAFEQIKDVLNPQGVDCVALPFRENGTQHLLGAIQLVDKDLALVRHVIVDQETVRFLERRQFHVVRVPENDEVRTRQAMNIVTVAPRTILMTNNCPETKELYRKAGLTIAAELELAQLINGAGGLACATGIIARD